MDSFISLAKFRFPTLTAQADQVADLPPPETRNGNLRFILIESYSENLGTPGCRSTPQENGNLRFILIDS